MKMLLIAYLIGLWMYGHATQMDQLRDHLRPLGLQATYIGQAIHSDIGEMKSVKINNPLSEVLRQYQLIAGIYNELIKLPLSKKFTNDILPSLDNLLNIREFKITPEMKATDDMVKFFGEIANMGFDGLFEVIEDVTDVALESALDIANYFSNEFIKAVGSNSITSKFKSSSRRLVKRRAHWSDELSDRIQDADESIQEVLNTRKANIPAKRVFGSAAVKRESKNSPRIKATILPPVDPILTEEFYPTSSIPVVEEDDVFKDINKLTQKLLQSKAYKQSLKKKPEHYFDILSLHLTQKLISIILLTQQAEIRYLHFMEGVYGFWTGDPTVQWMVNYQIDSAAKMLSMKCDVDECTINYFKRDVNPFSDCYVYKFFAIPFMSNHSGVPTAIKANVDSITSLVCTEKGNKTFLKYRVDEYSSLGQYVLINQLESITSHHFEICINTYLNKLEYSLLPCCIYKHVIIETDIVLITDQLWITQGQDFTCCGEEFTKNKFHSITSKDKCICQGHRVPYAGLTMELPQNVPIYEETPRYEALSQPIPVSTIVPHLLLTVILTLSLINLLMACYIRKINKQLQKIESRLSTDNMPLISDQ